MITRRNALRTALFGSAAAVASTTGAEEAPAAAQSSREMDEHAERVVTALNGIREEIAAARRFTEIASVRDAQKTFLRTNGKLPDYIEVGTDVWFAVHDWHVRWQQQMSLGRDPLGHYTIVLDGTVVVMRPELGPSFVGVPYDAK